MLRILFQRLIIFVSRCLSQMGFLGNRKDSDSLVKDVDTTGIQNSTRLLRHTSSFRRSKSLHDTSISVKKDVMTVMFADIVGFTEMSSRLDPEKVKDLLNRWFKTLEILADEFEIYEIETIGDSFICATNIFHEQEDHAARMAKFGCCAIKASENTRIESENNSCGNLTIRIGIHSGPCVASVVGIRHPKFTIFGDTVNVASRMETTSEPGLIQCTLDTANLILLQDPSIKLIKRGVINIKGKGFMQTYWIENTAEKSSLFYKDVRAKVSKSPTACKKKQDIKDAPILTDSFEMDWII